MTEAIATVGLQNAAEQIRDKIRSAFLELIPKEEWEKLVHVEIKKFFSKTASPYQSGFNPSPFEEVCKDVIREQTQAQLKKLLQKPEWQERFDGSKYVHSEAVQKWLTDNAERIVPILLRELLGSTLQQVVANMGGRT